MQYIAGLGDPSSLPDAGIDAEQIARHLKSNVDALMPYLEDLISEGHLFTTTDETQCVEPSSYVNSTRSNVVLTNLPPSLSRNSVLPTG